MLLLPIVYWISVLHYIGEEELFLREKFGEEWEEYSRKTPRFIPKLFELPRKHCNGERDDKRGER
ncbi:methyltransferase family protein [Pyrococcus abyssi]|uniref:Uncharacterized protein n=1 Tax=Pyrococcus abyssi (strain GE5 / Orsay) TaxID=272844 RepID=G8ZJH9_PYRAB|nr:TPA: hypothetical protein PAB0686.1n [Pyrococcus abyssi GE5]